MISSLIVAVTESLMIAIVAQAILSWFPSIRTLAPVMAFLRSVTGPLLDPIRRRLPTIAGLDLSPWAAVLLLALTQSLLLGALAGH